MSKKYEVYYYSETGISDPLSSKEEVRKLLGAEGIIILSDDDVESGSSFTDGNGNLIMISSYDDGEEDDEDE